MAFRLVFTKSAQQNLHDLEHDPQKGDAQKLKRVRRCLGLLECNPRHPGLHSHKYSSLKGANNEDVWESYVENHTPGAWRTFWHYGQGAQVITVVSIVPHP